MIDTLQRPIDTLPQTCLSCGWKIPFSKLFTGEEAILTFKPWHVFEEFISDKDPQRFWGRWPVMSAQRCADNQSKQNPVKPFYPTICMQEVGHHSDSLAWSGQDWPDRLPIRPATLPEHCVLFPHFSAASIRSDRHTAKSGKLRKRGSECSCSAINWLLPHLKDRTDPMLVILILFAGLCSMQVHCCYTSVHHPLCRV